jgi:hypothetical protein
MTIKNPDQLAGHPACGDAPGDRVELLLVQQLHRQVGHRLQTEQASRKARGLTGLVGESERQYARKLIADAITEHVEALLNRGETPLLPDVEHATGEAVYARMYGAGRLQRLLDDTSIENVDINGCDEVWVRRADGTKERGERWLPPTRSWSSWSRPWRRMPGGPRGRSTRPTSSSTSGCRTGHVCRRSKRYPGGPRSRSAGTASRR